MGTLRVYGEIFFNTIGNILWTYFLCKQCNYFVSVADSLDRRDKMKPSVTITSPGSPDTIYKSRPSRMMHPTGGSSIGGRIQVRFLLLSMNI